MLTGVEITRFFNVGQWSVGGMTIIILIILIILIIDVECCHPFFFLNNYFGYQEQTAQYQIHNTVQ